MPNHTFEPTLETPHLTLRVLEPHDAPDLLAIFSDAEVMRYWNTPAWASLQDAQDFIQHSHAALQAHTSITLGIFSKPADLLVGKCMLFQYCAGSRRAEIGFGLARAHWGKGYAHEACGALIRHGFNALGLRRIEAEIDPHNTGSAQALQRLGFVQEGLLRQRWEINGVVSDSALYGLLATDWQAR